MEKEVVAAADVDEVEELGYHEHEVSIGGEADLLRHYTRCQKNPGHSHFIPVRDFKIEHLPPGHRDKDIFDNIRAEAEVTCRLLVMCTSKNRPKYHPVRKHLSYPFSQYRGRPFIRTGTGFICRIFKYPDDDNKSCECDECERPGTHTPHKVWGKVEIMTATHVVFDDDEARRTTCYFGYDTRTTLLYQCLKLTGFRVERNNIEADVCVLTYVTHNMDIINKLDKMCRPRVHLFEKLYDKYIHNKIPSPNVPCPVVIISHPHGYSKHITVGMWTQRQTWSETFKHKDEIWETDMVNTSYTYNAHTCPGSSGAPIIKLPEKEKLWLFTPQYHSEAGEGNTNNNKSVVHGELVSPPTLLVPAPRRYTLH